MDKPTLEARKAQLKQQFDAAVSNANALQGAIQDTDYWLGVVAKAEADKNNAAVDAAVAATAPEAPVQA